MLVKDLSVILNREGLEGFVGNNCRISSRERVYCKLWKENKELKKAFWSDLCVSESNISRDTCVDKFESMLMKGIEM